MARIVASIAFLLAFASSSAAFAADYSPSFKSMEGELTRGQLVLNYEITPKSWKKLKKLEIKPQLNLYEARKKKDKFLDDQTIVSRKGSFTFSKKKVKLEEGDRLEIKIHGSGGDNRITAWHLGPRSGKKIAFRIQDGKLVVDEGSEGKESSSKPSSQPSPSEAPKGWRTDVVKACDQHAYISSQKGECVELAVKIEPKWAADAVEACNTYGYIDSQINQCLKIAAEHKRHSPAETAKACNEQTYIPSQFLECMKATADYKAPPAEMLPACSEAVYVDSQKMECFRLAASLDASEASLLSACDGRGWKKCVKAATGR